jgi:hypothetical protein
LEGKNNNMNKIIILFIILILVHRTGLGNNKDNDSSAGWIVIANESQTFDLILLQNLTDVLGEVNLKLK